MKTTCKKLAQYTLILVAVFLMGACSTAPIQTSEPIRNTPMVPSNDERML